MPVEPWFVPLAYAFILLGDNFGHPCVSWSHVYNKREMNEYPSPRNNASIVPRLMLARKFWAYGKTIVSYNDSGSRMSIIRTGRGTQLSDSPHALMVVLLNTHPTDIEFVQLDVGLWNVDTIWKDVTQQTAGLVEIINSNGSGVGTFGVMSRTVSVYVNCNDPNYVEVEQFWL
ncbi:hypothetical protein PFICI_06383 [Pestalotiopsis fici W106-1]|uniref:Alpha-galactosidase n=1 Tax=Pestalotiopsis fici (strain W106-1 / CGMCC3.15140) TaxID=1229662 RepID=W3X870_PESFW|nr:uncharacterized protein PFICI_06383 [Pestalotiopsis fici W106-1]ETS81381.1 hypothetical protein PFICI_06383 [Pestalotiopsis fici W106-1]